MKLLLTSNGFTPIIEKTFLGLLQKPVSENTVGFITTAAFGEDFDPTWNSPVWLEIFRNQLRALNITQIEDIDLKDHGEEALRKTLLSKDIIFVNGGNTFYLMYWVKKSGFDKIVREFLNEGRVYVGVSAGSVIACPTMESATWDPPCENRVGHIGLDAFNLVPCLIHPHFDESQRQAVEQESAGTKYPVVALNNEQAILVEGDKYKVVGEGEKFFLNGFKERI